MFSSFSFTRVQRGCLRCFLIYIFVITFKIPFTEMTLSNSISSAKSGVHYQWVGALELRLYVSFQWFYFRELDFLDANVQRCTKNNGIKIHAKIIRIRVHSWRGIPDIVSYTDINRVLLRHNVSLSFAKN